MSNLDNISIEFQENELEILKNDFNDNSNINGKKTLELIYKINVNDIFNENKSIIVTFIQVLLKFVNSCLVYLSNEQLQQWMTNVNNKIIIITLEDKDKDKDEVVINEILEFFLIQTNILINNKNEEEKIVDLSEWILNLIKLNKIFNNSKFEWKLHNKFLIILNNILTLDQGHTNLIEMKEEILSLISNAISHSQYIVRNEILNIIQILIKYKFNEEENMTKDIFNLIYNSLKYENNINVKNNKIKLLIELIEQVSINKDIAINILIFSLLEISQNDISYDNSKKLLISIKENEFIKKYVYKIICGNKIDGVDSPEDYLKLLIGCFSAYDLKEYLLFKTSFDLLLNKLIDIKRTIHNNNEIIIKFKQLSQLISNNLNYEELNGLLSHILSLNRIDVINSYEIDSVSLLNSFYQNKSDSFISTVEKIKIEEINSEKIDNVSNDDIINKLYKRLEPSSFFNREFNDVEDKTYFKKVDEFKVLAKSLLEILYIIVTQQEININNFSEILYCCSMFLGDEKNNKWSSSEIRIISKNIIKTVNEKLNKIENSEEFNEKLLINKYYENILLNKIKPLFNQPYRGSKTKKDFKNNIYDVQLWKTDHPASVYAFCWLTYNIEADQINKYFSNNVPIILTLIDDYQIPYKLLGVRLTNYCIINHTDPVQFRSTGLANVFLEALRLCLSFHSDTELMDESLPCIISLIKLMVNYNDPQNSPEFFTLVENIITEDIVKGLSLSIGKSTSAIYLKHIPLIVESIGIVSIRYLQIFIGPCCEILSFNYGDYKNQVYASKALLSLINVCIPRINKYIGIIMESTAECWRQLKKRESIRKDIDSKEQELKDNLENNLKDIYKVLMQTKIKSIENNIALLQLIDPTIYKDLLEI